MLARFEAGCRQEADGAYRELYADADMTLFVWYKDRAHLRRVVAFQILWPDDKMIAWNDDGKLSYCEVSHDDDSGLSGARSSVAIRDLGPIPAEVIEEFQDKALRIDRATADFVVNTVRSHNIGT